MLVKSERLRFSGNAQFENLRSWHNVPEPAFSLYYQHKCNRDYAENLEIDELYEHFNSLYSIEYDPRNLGIDPNITNRNIWKIKRILTTISIGK